MSSLRQLGTCLAVPLLILWGFAAEAVLPITGNGNVSAPPGGEDPGFAHVGEKSSGGLTLVYLGNGWVLTANHVGEADLKLDSVVYPRVEGSSVQLTNPDLTPADLRVYRVVGNPNLPDLPILEIASVSPAIGTPVTLIGRGFNQDAVAAWLQPGPPPVLRQGWSFGLSGGKIRWGTNRVEDPSGMPVALTASFVVDFTKPGDPGVTAHEAQAVTGDSGGAAFARNGEGEWELAGIMHQFRRFDAQPSKTALDGNLTYSADLAQFRSQLIAIVRPDCSDEVDNDGDGKVDYPEDLGCYGPEAASEADGVPSLGRVGIGILATLLAAAAVVRMRVALAPEARSRGRRQAGSGFPGR